MDDLDPRLADLSRSLGQRLPLPTTARLDSRLARERLLRSVHRARRLRQAGGMLALACALVLLVSLARLGGKRRLPAEITLLAGSEQLTGGLDGPLDATLDRALPLRFSEGTEVLLEAGSRGRVLELRPERKRFALESGAAEVRAAHVEGAQWLFQAGPFQVAVTGTRFRLMWDPVTSQLELQMREGSVVVSGGCLEGPRSASHRESLVIQCASSSASVPPAASQGTEPDLPDVAGSSLAEQPSATSAEGARRAVLATSSGARSSHASVEAPSWLAMARGAHFAEAVHAAEQAGFAAECASRSAGDVLALADAARLSGNLPRAEEAFSSVRARFPRTDAAADAAYGLGRIAFDGQRDPAVAARWFEVYLRERPQGPLASAAAGRWLEASERPGQPAMAQAAAHEYLRRFPRGPLAARARRMLASP